MQNAKVMKLLLKTFQERMESSNSFFQPIYTPTYLFTYKEE